MKVPFSVCFGGILATAITLVSGSTNILFSSGAAFGALLCWIGAYFNEGDHRCE